MTTEIASRTSFAKIRYAQVWEDGDILTEALAPQPGDHILSIASAGDNALALLANDPERVLAVDMNPSQIACVELRVAALRSLSHRELLQFVGSRPCEDRASLYQRARCHLSDDARTFWDHNPEAVHSGIGGAGRFENYFKLFRKYFLPLVHSNARIDELLQGGSPEQCRRFYDAKWNTLRWRLLFRLFFSRQTMGLLGRSPAFFQYVEGSVADRILARTQHALTVLDPSQNPWLHWILKGIHGPALPFWLREENQEGIIRNLDRLQWRLATIEEVLEREQALFHRFNLSDIFEYMSPENTGTLLSRIADGAAKGGRLVYWNMLAPRSRPETLASKLRPMPALADALHLRDRAFFYSRLVIEERVS